MSKTTLDEILFNLCDLSYASFSTQEEANRVADQLDYDRAEAKQALTSLIKEMVAEAKPHRKPQFLCQGCDKSEERRYNQAIKDFEQNLLKALEEVK